MDDIPNCWLIVAIGGVTCGGKTTLSRAIQDNLPHSELLSQDNYFYPDDSPHHIKVPGLDHNNYDILSSLDMDRMHRDVIEIITKKHKTGYKNVLFNSSAEISSPVLIVEGFSVLNYEPIARLCKLKYDIILSKDECIKRRNVRVYDPPDIPGYFDLCVWPEYIKLHEQLKEQLYIFTLDGTRNDLSEVVLRDIKSVLQSY